MVPRVAMFTTAGETRLTMGASEGIGAASAGEADGAGSAANAPGAPRPAASTAAAKRRKIMGCPRVIWSVAGQRTPAAQSVGRTFQGPAHGSLLSDRDLTRKSAFGGLA